MLLELLVAAATSTRPAIESLRPAMERASGGKVVLRFGATGTFARQIEQGAPFDLFFAADEMTPRLLGSRLLLDPESLRIYAEGTLVFVASPNARVPLPARVDAGWLKTFPTLSFRKLAIASPKVAPYGRAAKEVLVRAGVWDALLPRIVTSTSAEEVLAFVKSGNADLGFTAASAALAAGVRAVPVDGSLHTSLLQIAGVVRASPRRDAAMRALESATRPEARSIWERWGFLVPASPASPR